MCKAESKLALFMEKNEPEMDYVPERLYKALGK